VVSFVLERLLTKSHTTTDIRSFSRFLNTTAAEYFFQIGNPYLDTALPMGLLQYVSLDTAGKWMGPHQSDFGNQFKSIRHFSPVFGSTVDNILHLLANSDPTLRLDYTSPASLATRWETSRQQFAKVFLNGIPFFRYQPKSLTMSYSWTALLGPTYTVRSISGSMAVDRSRLLTVPDASRRESADLHFFFTLSSEPSTYHSWPRGTPLIANDQTRRVVGTASKDRATASVQYLYASHIGVGNREMAGQFVRCLLPGVRKRESDPSGHILSTQPNLHLLNIDGVVDLCLDRYYFSVLIEIVQAIWSCILESADVFVRNDEDSRSAFQTTMLQTLLRLYMKLGFGGILPTVLEVRFFFLFLSETVGFFGCS